jgi:tetratricopeptide (TPR) repeat protein
MGNFELAVADMERAIDLDPLNIEQLEGHATSLVLLRDYARAAAALDRILEIRPDLGSAFIDRAVWLPLVRDGDAESARSALRDPRLDEVDPAERYYLDWLTALYARRYDAALECLDHWQKRSESTAAEPQIAVLRGVTHRLNGESALAKTEFSKARPAIEDALRDDPDDPRLLIMQAQTLAGLGEHPAAVETVRRGVARLAERTELTALTGPADGVVAAAVYVMTGDHDAAAAQLESYLAGPGEWSLVALAADPRFEPLADRPLLRSPR